MDKKIWDAQKKQKTKLHVQSERKSRNIRLYDKSSQRATIPLYQATLRGSYEDEKNITITVVF